MSTDNLPRDLRDWNESDRDNHRPDQRGFCRTCSLRMPCDWANILDDVTEAADEIDRLDMLGDERSDEIDRLTMRVRQLEGEERRLDVENDKLRHETVCKP